MFILQIFKLFYTKLGRKKDEATKKKDNRKEAFVHKRQNKKKRSRKKILIKQTSP